ncbi:AIP3-domain-containing protein [Patellaria atrata CBS 101060]|uniref:AIP3-domain-containing protein n=1 Tax=Patellaria atrata CBS 101060 TaxID=1346257 RepID=A0A9P4SF47_9PEZI|nr:AIP3-domain-containing protein [Patellaria atrata CBS 101060]
MKALNTAISEWSERSGIKARPVLSRAKSMAILGRFSDVRLPSAPVLTAIYQSRIQRDRDPTLMPPPLQIPLRSSLRETVFTNNKPESDIVPSYSPTIATRMPPVAEEPGSRASQNSQNSAGRSSKRALTPQQQMSSIEKSVTHLLVATKQLLETLTQWSRGTATEAAVSDVYVRLGYEFNIASRSFNSIGVDTSDLGPVPDLLRQILEETLSQEASQASLDRFLPRIRDIIINLLHGLKKKQQKLRQRFGAKEGSVKSNSSSSSDFVNAITGGEDLPPRQSSSRLLAMRSDSGDVIAPDGLSELPPRTSSAVGGRQSPHRHETLPANPRVNRNISKSSMHSEPSSLSSETMQNLPVIAPYPAEDTMPVAENPPPSYAIDFPPPPPPPPKQDALAALQKGGDLERRASRRFSAYQIQKHLGGPNGIPMIPPSQNSPIPNRGRDVRESLNAVRARRSYVGERQRSANRLAGESSPSRITTGPVSKRISEETDISSDASMFKHPMAEELPGDSPVVKTPEDKLGPQPAEPEKIEMGATLFGPGDDPPVTELPERVDSGSLLRRQSGIPSQPGVRSKTKSPSPPQSQHFIPEQSPQPGKELTLFLQYKSKIKKFVLQDGYTDLTMARLQLAFIEKFAWNTHSNGIDLPEIYVQDPVSGVRHELEDLSDIKDRSVLVLNVEALDEVKRHIDEGIGGLRQMIEGIKTVVDEQKASIQRVSEKQQDAAKELASIASAPTISNRASLFSNRTPLLSPIGSSTAVPSKDSAAQLEEVQNLRRDLAIVRQTYSSFVSDINSTMSTIRSKASVVKSTAIKAAIPTLDGDSGRAYVNAGKKQLSDDAEKLITRVDDLQDLVEDLRKDVVSRGVRPLPRQLETVAKDISIATSELKKLQETIKRERPLWKKFHERELQSVCDDQEQLKLHEEYMADLEQDLEQAAETFALVEQATKQQNAQVGTTSGARSASANLRAVALDQAVDPRKAKDGVLGEVRALQPNHEGRLEAIERAERQRLKELESRKGGEFQKELGSFVEEGKLKKSGGVEEVERLRKIKDERVRREQHEVMLQREREKQERLRKKREAKERETLGLQTDGAQDSRETGKENASPPQEFVEAKEQPLDEPGQT